MRQRGAEGIVITRNQRGKERRSLNARVGISPSFSRFSGRGSLSFYVPLAAAFYRRFAVNWLSGLKGALTGMIATPNRVKIILIHCLYNV